MKTNFLCGNALLRGAGVFLKLGLSVVVLTLFCLSGYAQEQHVYLKFYHVEDMPTRVKVEPLSYSYYGRVDDETATLRLFENNSGNGFHAQLTLVDDVEDLFIRFGVSVGNFKRTYTINNEKLYYNLGHIDAPKNTIIDMYYNGELYQVHYNDEQIECEAITLSGFPEVFASSYGRTNTGEEGVNLSFDSYQGALEDCQIHALRCIEGHPCEFVNLDCQESGDIGCYYTLPEPVNCDGIIEQTCN